jgi:hypothetical protein
VQKFSLVSGSMWTTSGALELGILNGTQIIGIIDEILFVNEQLQTFQRCESLRSYPTIYCRQNIYWSNKSLNNKFWEELILYFPFTTYWSFDMTRIS